MYAWCLKGSQPSYEAGTKWPGIPVLTHNMAQIGNSNITLFRIVFFGLVALACFFAAKAAMVWLNPSSEWKAPRMVEGASATAPIGSEQPAFDYAFDAFHRDAIPEEFIEVEDVGEDAPDTTLNLTLKGFISPGRAIIEGVDRKQTSYGVGDEVTNGVTVGSIYPENEYVILIRAGAKERLSIKRQSEMDASTKPARTTPGQSKSVSPAEVLDSLTFRPVINSGRTIGYRIASAPGVDLNSLGFRSGDVLTKIGDQDLTQPGLDLKEAIMEAVISGNPTAQIMRRGRKMTIRVKMP